MAAAISASVTRTIRSAPAWMIAKAAGSGTRQATPSANVSAVSVVTIRAASKERAIAGARAETTPTIRVGSPSRSRVRINPQIPDPMPIGT